MLRPAVLLFVLQVLPSFAIIKKQPEFVKTCYIKQENFINCSTHAVQRLFDELPNGIKEIGLKSLDPLLLPKIQILQGNGPVNVNASLTDVKIVGFGKSIIIKNRVDPKTYDFYTDMKVPRIRIDGKYALLGRILVIPLRGAGSCWFDATDLDIQSKNDIKIEEHDGFKFFKITGTHVKFSIGGLKLHMGNLFDGIKALEETTNAYLNENWKLAADALNPILTGTIEDIMFGILKKVFDNIPADFFVADID